MVLKRVEKTVQSVIDHESDCCVMGVPVDRSI